MEKRFVTIHDVAADARVSTATVSRALNEPWRASQATKERVAESVEMLNSIIKNDEPAEPVVLPVKLVLRDSAGRVNLRV